MYITNYSIWIKVVNINITLQNNQTNVKPSQIIKQELLFCLIYQESYKIECTSLLCYSIFRLLYTCYGVVKG